MLEISYSIYELEKFLLILVRIASFMYIAPFFGQVNTPQKTKIGFAFFVSFLVYSVLPDQEIIYETTLDYAVAVIKESIAGLLIGFASYICSVIVIFAGNIIDMEIGLSMATIFDPQTKNQVTVSGQFYQTIFMLLFIVSGMYWFLLSAMVDSFTVIPLAGVKINPELMNHFIGFLGEYFLLGFRIAMPIFACELIMSIVLGIMTKVAPQIHMFSIGMQLKIITGLIVMFVAIVALPNIASYIFEEMKQVTISVIGYLQ